MKASKRSGPSKTHSGDSGGILPWSSLMSARASVMSDCSEYVQPAAGRSARIRAMRTGAIITQVVVPAPLAPDGGLERVVASILCSLFFILLFGPKGRRPEARTITESLTLMSGNSYSEKRLGLGGRI